MLLAHNFRHCVSEFTAATISLPSEAGSQEGRESCFHYFFEHKVQPYAKNIWIDSPWTGCCVAPSSGGGNSARFPALVTLSLSVNLSRSHQPLHL